MSNDYSLAKGSNLPPPDCRFPTTKQTRQCWALYNEFLECVNQKGEEAAVCGRLWKWTNSVCLSKWIETFNEAREEDVDKKWWGVRNSFIPESEEE